MTQLVVHVPGRLFIKVTPGKKEKGKKLILNPLAVTLSVTVEMEARSPGDYCVLAICKRLDKLISFFLPWS
jgi:hypothetical protein